MHRERELKANEEGVVKGGDSEGKEGGGEGGKDLVAGCSQVRGDKLYHPFWEAVYRLENCGMYIIHTSAPKVFYTCIPHARY